MFSSRPPSTEITVLGGRRRRRPRHTAKKADRNPYTDAIASWTTHDAAVDASRATLDAADPAAAMRKDIEVLTEAWQDKQAKMLSGDGGKALSAMTKEEAQALLGKASKEGDIKGMERAVAAGADVHAAVYHTRDGSMDGNCTAAYVVTKTRRHGLRFLVGACGVDPNAVGCTSDQGRPIHIACMYGNPDAVTVLLALGADPTVASWNGYTAFMYAAATAQLPCLRVLVAGGPAGAFAENALNVVNGRGKTALDIALNTAVNTNRTEFVAVLRELGGKRAQDL